MDTIAEMRDCLVLFIHLTVTVMDHSRVASWALPSTAASLKVRRHAGCSVEQFADKKSA
jgi:hypothetical protein